MLNRKLQYYLYKISIISKHPIEQFFMFLLSNYWGVNLGNRVKFLGFTKILNMNKITIGDNTRIISGKRNLVGYWIKTCFETGQNGNIIIGKNVGLSNCVLISQSEINIGNDVYIGGGTCIYDNDFHSINRSERLNNPKIIPTKKIKINNGVFIGGHCIVLKGVTIGENSIVAAGSVVASNIPSNEVWGGVPAKKIKNL